MVDVRRLTLGAGGALVGAAAAVVSGRALVRRARHAPDAESGQDFGDLADLGVEHRTVPTRDGGSLHVLGLGQGRPLVLLHGITLRAGAWRYQFALADRYRIVAPDLRGHGRSVAGSAGYGLDPLAADLADVLERLDLRGAVLVGHSMGGMAVMRFAARHPDVLRDRVAALAFVSTSADPVLGFSTGGSLRRLAAAVQGPAERIGWRRLPTYRPTDGDLHFGLIRLSFGEGTPPHLIEAVREMMQAMEPEAMNRSFLGLLANDELAHLPSIRVPTSVVVGSRDPLTPSRAARRMVAAIRGAELHVVPGAGHQLMMERPAELAVLLDALVARVDMPAA